MFLPYLFRRLLLLMSLLVVSQLFSSCSPPLIPVEDALAYLKSGGVESLQSPTESREFVKQGHPEKTWWLYLESAQILANEKVVSAVPVLVDRVTNPLPEQIRHDMMLSVASRSTPDQTWEDWDRQAFQTEQRLRAACAQALITLDQEAAVKVAVPLVQQWREWLKVHSGGHIYDNQQLAYAATDHLRALIQAGRPEGVDLLIGLLPYAPLHEYDRVWGTLYEELGHQVAAPMYGGEEVRDALAESWAVWWQDNRNTLNLPIPPDRRPKGPEDYPEKPSDPEDHLRYVTFSPSMYCSLTLFGTQGRERAQEWLDKNAHEHPQIWRGLAEDTKEPPRLRVAAGALFVLHGGSEAQDWVLPWLATLEKPQTDQDAKIAIGKLFRAMETTSPGEGVRIAKESIRKRTNFAESAFLFLTELCRQQEFAHLEFLLEEYLVMADQFTMVRHNFWEQMRNKDFPGRTALVEAQLVSGNLRDALVAGRIIRSAIGEHALSKAGQDALEEWKKNPHFLFDILADQNATDYGPVLDVMHNQDPEAAFLYSRVFRHSVQRGNPTLSPTAVRALEGLKACANAYLERLDQPTPLPAHATLTQ